MNTEDSAVDDFRDAAAAAAEALGGIRDCLDRIAPPYVVDRRVSADWDTKSFTLVPTGREVFVFLDPKHPAGHYTVPIVAWLLQEHPQHGVRVAPAYLTTPDNVGPDYGPSPELQTIEWHPARDNYWKIMRSDGKGPAPRPGAAEVTQELARRHWLS